MVRQRASHLVWIACVALLNWHGSAAAQESHATLRGFYPTGEFDLVVGDAKVQAQVLFSRRATAYLIVAPDKKLYLIRQKERKVALVEGSLVPQKNGDVDLSKDATAQVVGTADVRGGNVLIEAGAFRGRLTPRAAALGTLRGADLMAHSPQYGLIARAYRTDEGAIKVLQGASGVVVETFFGSWCPRCQQSLGNAIAIESALGGKGVAFSYYGLPAAPAAWKEPRYLSAKIKGLPAAVVSVNGRVVGRIGPNDWKHFDVAIAKLLKN